MVIHMTEHGSSPDTVGSVARVDELAHLIYLLRRTESFFLLFSAYMYVNSCLLMAQVEYFAIIGSRLITECFASFFSKI